MFYVFLSVICSVLVSVLLKLARRFDIDVGQAIAWNYLLAGALTVVVLRPSLEALHAPDAPWLAIIGLALLLPTIFLALAASVRHAGIVRSDAAQRLSLMISLLAAFLLFGEQLTGIKLVGIALGLFALFLMVRRPESGGSIDGSLIDHVYGWLYPLLVFGGFGMIDILFKRVAQAGVPIGASLQVVFALALPVAFAIQLWRRMRGSVRFTVRNIWAGLALGLANFGNILFYLRGHQALPQHPALVFASMNIGVVALGALVGLLAFRERLDRINFVGVALALLAIGVIGSG
jgi:drug/metabolite transporter (DMT)-like permease